MSLLNASFKRINLSYVKPKNNNPLYINVKLVFRSRDEMKLITTSDVCHERTDLKVFVVVIPKEGWARMAAPILLLV